VKAGYGELDQSAREVTRLCDETEAAADAILEHSELWLALHPIRCWRLRRDMLRKRKAMIAARDRHRELARRFLT
jgi:hypothetical protein